MKVYLHWFQRDLTDRIHCLNVMAVPVETGCININYGITHTTSQMPGEMGRFGVKSKEKMPSNANKIGKGFGGRNSILPDRSEEWR